MEKIDCLGIGVARIELREFHEWLDSALDHDCGPGKSLFIVNAHTLNLACKDAIFHSQLCQASLVLNDGLGLSLAARTQGTSFPHNFNGTDLFPEIFRTRAEQGKPLRLFLYGAAPGRATAAAALLEEKYHGLAVVGCIDGFDPRSPEDIVALINQAKPHMLLVALGNPRQEQWIGERLNQLDVRVAAGVGALIDFLSNSIPRAPRWMRTIRCEWVFRLAREPRRLFARYVLGNPMFLVRLLLYAGRRGK